MNRTTKPVGKMGNKLIASPSTLRTSNMNMTVGSVEPKTPKEPKILKTPKLPEPSKRNYGLDRRVIFKKYAPNNVNDMDIDFLLNLQYDNGDFKIQEKDVIIEVVGMLRLYETKYVLDFLEDAPNKEWIFWEQEFMNVGKVSVEREIFINRAEEIGVKGAGKCRFCSGTELVFAQKQVNSGDEPMKVYVRCVTCNQHWRQG
jgi:DNA-directed RNA polymerase subunit M/transcription elongation factor TFIIS